MKNLKITTPLVIIALVVIICVGISLVLAIWQNKQTSDLAVGDDQFTKINECITDVSVDFNSETKVNSVSDVENVFNKFIANSKENNKEIFGHDPNYYKFKSAAIYGIYRGKKYWKVTSDWHGNDPEIKSSYNKWQPEEIFKVSQDGEVVRLLVCT